MLVLALAAAFAACARASGELRGENLGELEPTDPPPFLGCDLTEQIDAGNGNTWADLYRDLFGPGSAAACANAACHGSEEGAGIGSFRCLDTDVCKASAKGMLREGDEKEPENSGFVDVLKRCDDNRERRGIMPREPRSYLFSRKSIARVKAWIADGAL